ncbi:hypothetical protein RKE25_22380 (plasmid) [Dyella sp. BiH032]|uniref:hypothetical protein n=1 Tax=Dyella sp. BiH032 TaxID=3075430 RepID=UPI0028930E17|nr:hypothetical protein [Dyella sp. BiH032]WNL48480.1 hypothetical protein RKE25_22380 [Dyella sp. BiH032]
MHNQTMQRLALDSDLEQLATKRAALLSAANSEQALLLARDIRAHANWVVTRVASQVLASRYPGVRKVGRANRDLFVIETGEGVEIYWPRLVTSEELIRRNRGVLGLGLASLARSVLPALLSSLGVSPTPVDDRELEVVITELTDLLEDLALPISGELPVVPSIPETTLLKGGLSEMRRPASDLQ